MQGVSCSNATVTFNFFTEQGSIIYDFSEFVVQKHGWLSDQWSLIGSGRTHASAQKSLLRRFEVCEGDRSFVLKAQPMTRCYDIFQNEDVIGTIRPAHPFTRRAFVECGSAISELGQLFCFWLAALTWRRAARDNASHTP